MNQHIYKLLEDLRTQDVSSTNCSKEQAELICELFSTTHPLGRCLCPHSECFLTNHYSMGLPGISGHRGANDFKEQYYQHML